MFIVRSSEGFYLALKWQWLFLWVFFIACILFVLSLWDLFFNIGLKHITLFFYAVLFITVLFLFTLMMSSKKTRKDIVRVFEKTLQGRLYHFKCPHCLGVFAIKESMNHDHKPLLLTCPDCGHLGLILPDHKVAKQKIPKKKSGNVLLRCPSCGESLKIWAEGTRLYPYVQVFCCPYCGAKKPLKRI